MKKIAITLPDAQADAIERIRTNERVPRSRVIQEAVALYLAQRSRRRAIRRYERGYLEVPERDEAESYALASREVLGNEEWR